MHATMRGSSNAIGSQQLRSFPTSLPAFRLPTFTLRINSKPNYLQPRRLFIPHIQPHRMLLRPSPMAPFFAPSSRLPLSTRSLSIPSTPPHAYLAPLPDPPTPDLEGIMCLAMDRKDARNALSVRMVGVRYHKCISVRASY